MRGGRGKGGQTQESGVREMLCKFTSSRRTAIENDAAHVGKYAWIEACVCFAPIQSVFCSHLHSVAMYDIVCTRKTVSDLDTYCG